MDGQKYNLILNMSDIHGLFNIITNATSYYSGLVQMVFEHFIQKLNFWPGSSEFCVEARGERIGRGSTTCGSLCTGSL